MGDKVPLETYSQLCTDLDLANVKIKRLEKELSDLNSDYHYKTHELSDRYHDLKRRMQQALKEE